MGRLFLQLGIESTALDHESGDDPVEDGSGIIVFLDIAQKVLHRYGRLLIVQFEGDLAHVGFHNHLLGGLSRQRAGGQQRGGKQNPFHRFPPLVLGRPLRLQP